jgi:transposase-like protein
MDLPQSWYADETYLTVQGRSCYLYRIDRDGNLIDTMLSGTRDNRAAQRFFRSARSVVGHRVIQPDVRVGTGRCCVRAAFGM